MWPSTPQARHIGLQPEFFFLPNFEQQHHPLNASIGVIPLLTATPCLAQNDDETLNVVARSRSGMQLWQQHNESSYLKKVDMNHGTSVSNASSLGTATCQDCGNQAKKDCPHRRCRTCCKSRGYDCSTHVKSTWVPVARRRERQLLGVNATPTTGGGSSQSNSSAKRARLASQTTSHTSTSNTTPPRSFDATSTHQDASFKESLPGQVRAPAVFKCVRVTAVDGGDDEYAYQAVVNIGGHVFKGFLYDQGAEGKDIFPNMSELNLGGGRNVTSSSQTGMDPSDIYGGSGCGLLGASNYDNHQIN